MYVTKTLHQRGLITPPPYVVESIQYETIMGSEAYGVSSGSSDVDIYGFCIPPKHIIFPHLHGYVRGFGKEPENFEQYQQHHIKYDNGKEYDIQIYNIVKYFSLCMDNNPNMIDSLFTPSGVVTLCTRIGGMVKDNRKMFLHKGAWHRFKGYAYSQLKKIHNKNPVGKRVALVEEFGYDVKFGYHLVRLMNEVEQILMHGDIDIRQNREQLKAIRRGEWTLPRLEQWFEDKEKNLERLYVESKLQKYPDYDAIKQLLIDCLEEHYGSLSSNEVRIPDQMEDTLREIRDLAGKALR